MRPQWYCDALPLIVGGDTGASGPVLRNRMLSLLHGIFTQRPGAFAVAFPGREQLAVLPLPLTGALRVFASSREDMDWLAENVISQPWFRDYARLSYPRAVPADFRGEWVRFVRYRVPSLSSDRHEGEGTWTVEKTTHGNRPQGQNDVFHTAQRRNGTAVLTGGEP